MQRQRGEVVPIGDALSGTGRAVKALQPSPQARHHFTRADQVNQLVSASEADPDLGFMARTMALCSLPRTNPGNQHQYKRVNGNYRSSGLRSLHHNSPLSAICEEMKLLPRASS